MCLIKVISYIPIYMYIYIHMVASVFCFFAIGQIDTKNKACYSLSCFANIYFFYSPQYSTLDLSSKYERSKQKHMVDVAQYIPLCIS